MRCPEASVGRRHVPARVLLEARSLRDRIESFGHSPHVGVDDVRTGLDARRTFAQELPVDRVDVTGTGVVGRGPLYFVAHRIGIAAQGQHRRLHGQQRVPFLKDGYLLARRGVELVVMDASLPEQVGHHLVPASCAHRRNEPVLVKSFDRPDLGCEQAQPEVPRQAHFVFDEGFFVSPRLEHLILPSPLHRDVRLRDALFGVLLDEPTRLDPTNGVDPVPVHRRVGIVPGTLFLQDEQLEELARPVIDYADGEVVVDSLPLLVQ